MKEAHVRLEVSKLLMRLWYHPHRLPDAVLCPKCHTKILPPVGRPDLLVNSAYGPGVYVEVKILNEASVKSFAFSKIEEKQYDYLDWLTANDFRAYLALGTVNGKRGRRRLWIVDWPAWLDVKQLLESVGQASVPLIAGKGFKKVLQERHLDLVNLLANYECTWKKGWHLPSHHSLWQANTPQKGEKIP